MPATRKPARPHPRSLTALFGPPPKPRRCTRGHTQTPEWKPRHGCSTCEKQNAAMREVALAQEAVVRAQRERERAEATKALPALPDPYVLRDYHGRVVATYRAGGRGRKRRRR